MKTLIVALLAIFLSLTQVSAHAAEGKILFSSERDGNAELYVMNADGTGVQRLTRHPADDFGPVLSPDGKQIAFASNRDQDFKDPQNFKFDIYVMDANGRNVQRLTRTGCDLYPAWSPDGKQIAFTSWREERRNEDIYLMNADGTNQRKLTNHPFADRHPSWSPDGTKIVYESDDQAPQHDSGAIYVIDVATGKTTDLSRDGKFESQYEWPVWSPDGSKIAYILETFVLAGGKLTRRNLDIWIMDANGENRVNITNSQQMQEWRVLWSPSGDNRLIYSATPSNRDGDKLEFDKTMMYIIDVNGGNRIEISKDDTAFPSDWVQRFWAVNPLGKLLTTWGRLKGKTN